MNRDFRHRPGTLTRRDFLFRAGGGFGGLALTAMLAQDHDPGGRSCLSRPGDGRTREPLVPGRRTSGRGRRR